MPAPFSDRERQIIRQRLLDEGAVLFAAHGVRRTTVEELARAAGISKGAFYLFYSSKAALFLDVAGRIEQERRARALETIGRVGKTPRENLKDLLRQAVAPGRQAPQQHRFRREDFDYLARKLPDSDIQPRLFEDEEAIAGFLDRWRQAGVQVSADARRVAGLVKALHYLSLHERDLGADYAAVLETLIELVAAYAMPGEE